MEHTSIKMDTPCELINITPLNPLISKCQIKVCYVGETPNRNKSIITKEVAKEMANSLPGSPIVGKWNEESEDFEEHNKAVEFKDGKFILSDDTRPYGFVDLGAKVWFQKFLDDGKDEREYLVTEGYLWTGQYPECGRVIAEGNNQSMELDKNFTKGTWTKDINNKSQFFIINETIVSKLCILGDKHEPCFEGANITKEDAAMNFSFDENFKTQLFSLMEEMKKILDKGGEEPVFNTYSVEIGDALWCALCDFLRTHYPAVNRDYPCSMYSIRGIFEETDGQKFVVLFNNDDKKLYRLNFEYTAEGLTAADAPFAVEETYIPLENMLDAAAVEEYENQFAAAAKEEEEEVCPNCGKNPCECACHGDDDEDKKKEYALEEIPEYVELNNQFSELTTAFNELKEQFEALTQTNNELAEFKAQIVKEQKQEMINKFYMLSEEDKQDVITNIDTYSLDEIEAKLSVICVRNKVSFDLDDDKDADENPITYSLGNEDFDDDDIPAWVKAAQSVAKTLK